jgi:trimeric autotransporter adhesin
MRKFMFLAVALLGLVACSDDIVSVEEPITIDPLEVVLTPAIGFSTTIQSADTSRLSVSLRGGPLEFTPTWRCTSSNGAVAVAVDNQLGCLVTGVAEGTSNISAIVTRGIYTSTANIAVRVIPNPNFIPVPARVNVVVPTSGFVRDTLRASAVPLTTAGDTIRELAVTWASSNTAVATVSPLGDVTLVSGGTATISATVAGVTGSTIVTSNLVPVQSVALSQTGELYVGRTATATPVITGTDGTTLPLTQRIVVWRSSNPAIATIDGRGVITGVSVGTTRILLAVDGELASLDVAVTRVAVDSVAVKVKLEPGEVAADTTTITLGGVRQFVATAFDANGDVISNTSLDGRTFEWSTIRIDNNNQTTRLVTSTDGFVTATALGLARVRARIEGVTGLAVVEVVQP